MLRKLRKFINGFMKWEKGFDDMTLPRSYVEQIKARSFIRFWGGALARFPLWWKTRQKLRKMRQLGAEVGTHVGIAPSVTVPASEYVKIGDHVSIHSEYIDTRAPLAIGNYVIVGDNVRIITCSHDIDSVDWAFKSYGLVIEDYVWLATGAMILPSCRRIGRGAVVGAGSVVVADVPPMAVVSGNPAKILRYRRCVHDNLLPEKFFCGDLSSYFAARFVQWDK